MDYYVFLIDDDGIKPVVEHLMVKGENFNVVKETLEYSDFKVGEPLETEICYFVQAVRTKN